MLNCFTFFAVEKTRQSLDLAWWSPSEAHHFSFNTSFQQLTMEMKVFFQKWREKSRLMRDEFRVYFSCCFYLCKFTSKKKCEFLFLFTCAHYYDDSYRKIINAIYAVENINNINITIIFSDFPDQNLQVYLEKLRFNFCNRSTSEITRSECSSRVSWSSLFWQIYEFLLSWYDHRNGRFFNYISTYKLHSDLLESINQRELAYKLRNALQLARRTFAS